MILTTEQRDAVRYDSHVLLTACPGSGKTRTLVAKMLRCLGEVRGTSRRVACITYTNAAVHEIEHRLRDYCRNGDEDYSEISTIHTFCLQNILRPFAWRLPFLADGFQVASPDSDEFRQASLEVVEAYGLDARAREAFEHLNRNIDGSPSCPDGIAAAAAIEFWARLQSRNRLDFCGIVYWSYYLLRSHPSIATGVASYFKWILVDEFQDTSELQVEIFLLLAAQNRSLFFTVGDTSQSIYSFAGARPDLLDRFRRRLGARTNFRLKSNFRSSARIVTHAERLLPRKPAMLAHGPDANHPFEPCHIHAESRFLGITDHFVPSLEELGIPLGKAAILAPTWFVLVPLARELRDFGIPVVGPGARPYKSTRVFARLAEQVCAYIENPRPERIAEIEKELFILLANLSGKANYRVFSYEGRRAVLELIQVGRHLRDRSEAAATWLELAAGAFARVLCDSGYVAADAIAVLEDSAQLMKADMEGHGIDIENLALADLGMFACPDANLKLLTLHGAKGREFDAVALIDIHEGRIPHYRDANHAKKLEESKRLFYVGITRARKVLMYFTDKSDARNTPTRFLADVQPRAISRRLSR